MHYIIGFNPAMLMQTNDFSLKCENHIFCNSKIFLRLQVEKNLCLCHTMNLHCIKVYPPLKYHFQTHLQFITFYTLMYQKCVNKFLVMQIEIRLNKKSLAIKSYFLKTYQNLVISLCFSKLVGIFVRNVFKYHVIFYQFHSLMEFICTNIE